MNEALVWLPLAVLLGGWVASRFTRSASDAHVLAFVCLEAVLFRLPYVLTNAPLNPDEDIILAFGINLARNPIIFDSVEPTTQGILHAYVPAALHLCAGLVGYAYSVLHLLSAFVHAACLALLHSACKRLFGREAAIFGVLIGLLFLIFSDASDFVHYHNEIESLLLLCLCLSLIARLETEEPRVRMFVWIGVTLGCLPYAKLQSIPLASVLAAWALAILVRSGASAERKRRYAGGFALAVACPSLALLAVLQLHGLTSEFFFYYLRANLGYGYTHGFLGSLRAFQVFMPGSAIAAGVLVLPLVVLAAPTALRTRSFVFLACLFVATCDAIARPGWFFPHYYSYFLPFLTLGGAFGYRALASAAARRWISAAALGFCGVSLLLSAAHRRDVLAASGLAPIVPGVAARAILELATSPDDSIAVWGWYPVLNVETNLPSATKENHSFYTLYSPFAAEFEMRYLRDLARNRPVVFVDSRVMWVERYVSFERKPAIARFVAENYTYLGSFPGSRFYAGNPVDIYVDKQRAKLPPGRRG